jgi:hypothetical protein
MLAAAAVAAIAASSTTRLRRAFLRPYARILRPRPWRPAPAPRGTA